MDVELPVIDLPGGLHVVIGGFVEVDESNQQAIKLTYVGGSTRILTKEQSLEFRLRTKLKSPTAAAASPGSIFRRNG